MVVGVDGGELVGGFTGGFPSFLLVACGQGGNDLIGVHIRGGARARLEDVDGEFVVVFAGDNLVCGGDDGFTGGFVDNT